MPFLALRNASTASVTHQIAALVETLVDGGGLVLLGEILVVEDTSEVVLKVRA